MEMMKNDVETHEEEMEKKLKNLLKELFQFDMEPLDFGIYRIMNQKRDQVRKFIQEDLIEKVEEEFQGLYEQDKKELEEEIKDLKRKIRKEVSPDAIDEDGELNPMLEGGDLAKEYKAKRKALESVESVDEDKAQIFSWIYNFFSRYYEDGDFIPKRRWSERGNKYVIPYSGEEVTMYWANKDQYYIKTGEYFKKYSFEAGDFNIDFKLQEAKIDKNNIKGDEKYFILCSEDFIEGDFEENRLTIYFEFREFTEDEYDNYKNYSVSRRQEKLVNNAFDRIKRELEGHPDAKRELMRNDPKSEEDITILKSHLSQYVAKNTRDFFIHKNLNKFLENELDFYIKNEVLHLNDIEGMPEDELRKSMRRVRVMRSISEEIIDFLHSIEEFQRKLWEKKKFVLNTEYVITLDKIKEYKGEEYLTEEILPQALQNEGQLEDWNKLFGIEVKEQKDLMVNRDVEDNSILWEKLPIDTKHFNLEFKFDLLENISVDYDLDEILDGIIIKSENWQGLNTLEEKYKNNLDTIYIDPPFNTKNREILYKNTYKNSSWLSLMENRLEKSKNIMSENSSMTVAIDEYEQEYLGLLLDKKFPSLEKNIITIIHNPGGTQGKHFKSTHEYAYFLHPEDIKLGRKNREGELVEDDPDERPFRDVSKGDHLREDAENCFYPIYIKDNEIVGFGDVCDDSFHPESANIRRDDVIEVYPIDASGNERKWVFARQNIDEVEDELEVFYNNKRDIYDIKRVKKDFKYKTVWKDKKYNSNTYGSKLLNNIMGEVSFTFPKSIYNIKDCLNVHTQFNKDAIILDYFAGSGTTGHATMLLNREDNGNRKFILIEMADYFNTVLIPRIKKVAYSFDWKDGEAQEKNGRGVFFKYQELEQYEDTLNNIEFEDEGDRLARLEEFDDYMFHMLDFETRDSVSRLNLDAFKKPFKYWMWVLKGNGGEKKETVDLIETFNYLLGLQLNRVWSEKENDRKYVWVTGRRNNEDLVVVWRNTENIDFEDDKRYIEGKISDLFEEGPNKIFINFDSYIDDAISIEHEFERRMKR